MSPLLENECPLSFDQEVELYKETSLRKGVRGRIAVHETRRQLLEGLHHLLTGDESLITDLWVNYDCDMQRGNMFDFLISFVTQRAVPWPESPDDSEDEAFLDIMLFFLIRIANRAGVEPPQGKWAQLLGLPADAGNDNVEPADIQGAYREETAGYESVADIPLTMAQLQDRKMHKETMSRAAHLFNEKPKDGIAYLQKVGVLPPDNSTEMAQQLARFLRETPTLDKKLLGEFLAKPSNLEVLQSYIQQFDFSGRRLDEALRSMLGTFRLPGESQQIERIMETFAAAYSAGDPADVANKDAGFVLSYAVIMLNVDQHSVKVKNRMRYEDFARNLRGVNDGQDFRSGFLTDVYNAIRDREIIFPEEHEGEAGFDYAWREISSDDSSVGSWVTTRGRTAQYDHGVLAATWPRLL
ncbi:GDP/GTP exchange factor for ARF, partial [Linderina macrospora]